MALLTKLAWQLQCDSSKLWVQIFQKKYFPHQELLTALSYKQGTWVWKGIVEGVPLLKRGACFLARERKMSIIAYPWLPTICNF